MSEDTSAELPHTDLHDTLGIRTREMTKDRVVLELDVGPPVHQPMAMLHGGVSAVLAEGAASLGANLNCAPGEVALGIELNVSHLRGRSSGTVVATALPLRKGRSLHVWQVEIVGDDGKLVAVARCSVAIRSVPDTHAQTSKG